MPSADNRVVSLTFDNAQFEAAVAQTLGTLEALRKGLQFADAGASLQAISSIDDNFSLSGMAGAVDDINSKFGALGATAFSVIQRIVNGGFDAAKSLASIVFDPIIEGGKQRALNIDNAKFAFRTLGIDVEAAMESARAAVTGTAFGLDEAAKSAGMLGASGIGAGAEMTQALRGIAGAAAITNSAFGDISDIYTAVAAKGTISNGDLQRFAQRGLNATATLAEGLGITQEQVKELARDGEISFAQFSEVMDGAFGEQAQKANETYAGSLANMRAALSRLGAVFQGPLLTQQRDLFNAISPAVDRFNKAITPMLNALTEISRIYFDRLIAFINTLDFAGISGKAEGFIKTVREFFTGIYSPAYIAIEGIKAAFQGVWDILIAVKDAFVAVFPPATGGEIAKIAYNFRELMRFLQPGPELLAKIQSIFKGVFSVIAIGWEILKGITGVFVDLFQSLSGPASDGGGGIVGFFASLGDALFSLKQALVDGGSISDFFNKISDSITGFVEKVDAGGRISNLFNTIKDAISSFFKFLSGEEVSGGADNASGATERLADRFSVLGDVVNSVKEFFSKLGEALGNLISGGAEKVGEIFTSIAGAFAGFVTAVAEGIGSGDFSNLLDVLNTGIFAFLILTIKKFLDGGLLNAIGGNGFKDVVVDLLDGVSGALKGLEQNLKAEALLKIAKAVALLVVSLVILSLIDSAKLTKALVALTATFGLLAGMLAAVEKIVPDSPDKAKIAEIAFSLLVLSAAVLLLSISVAIFSLIPTEKLIQGIIGIAAVLGLLVLVTKTIDGDEFVKAAFSLGLMAVAVGLLVLPVIALGFIPFEKLVQGLLAVGILLGLLVLVTNTVNTEDLLKTGAAMLVMAIAVGALALSVLVLGLIPFENMVQGLLAVGIALGLLVLAMNTMPSEGEMLAFAGALLIISGAMLIMAVAIGMLGSMGLGDLIQGLLALVAVLVIMGIAAQVISVNVLGAVGLMAFAASLLVLAVAMTILGQLSLAQIGIALLALIGVILVLAVAGLIIGAAAPAIAGVATALLALGAAAFLAGVGIALAALGFWLMADAIGALVNMIQGNQAGFLEAIGVLAQAIPVLILAIGEALIAVADKFVTALPGLILKLGMGIQMLIQVLIALAPQFGLLINVIIETMVNAIRENLPKLVDTGYFMLLEFLRGLSENIEEIVNTVATIIVTFLNALAERINEIVAAGLNLLTQFLQGIADNIAQVYTTAYSIIAEILRGIADGIGLIIAAGADLIIQILFGIASNIYRVVDSGFDIITALMRGVANRAVQFADDAFVLVTDFLNALADVIRRRDNELADAGKNLVSAILDGMTNGIGELGGVVVQKFKDLGSSMIDGIKGIFGINSPSKVMHAIGEGLALGLTMALDEDTTAESSAVSFASGVVSTMQESLAGVSDLLSNMNEFNPTITPVLDLSNVEAGASRVGGILGSSTLGSSISFGQASAIAQSTAEQTQSDASGTSPTVQEIKFEQIINSPKELSAGDIYRNTKSQLAMAKEGLKNS